MAETREGKVYLAKLAEQAERYDEMATYMKDVAKRPDELSVEERNLLSVAYKNAVGSRRASWRIVSSVEQKEQSKGNSENRDLAQTYRIQVEKELDNICQEILDLLKLLDDRKNDENGESNVFFKKMEGDYYRYIAEYKSDAERPRAAEKAKQCYEKAMEVAKSDLLVTHPIRLGLALNFSVFYYEVLNNPEEACKMARTAFEEAIAELDNVSEESYKDSTLIMQLLRDNLTLWTSDASDNP